jgi:hypothetical protein
VLGEVRRVQERWTLEAMAALRAAGTDLDTFDPADPAELARAFAVLDGA